MVLKIKIRRDEHMGPLLCRVLGMWCSDTDEGEYLDIGCDGRCKGCEESELVALEED